MAALKHGTRIEVKKLKIGDTVEINGHDYYYKAETDVLIRGGKVRQIHFMSTKTDFNKYFNRDLYEALVEWDAHQKKYIWKGKPK